LKRINEKGIKWLIWIAEKDELTDEGATLSALDYVDAELSVFPKGHASIATSWSNPASKYALDKEFYIESRLYTGKCAGRCAFQLDLKGKAGPSGG